MCYLSILTCVVNFSVHDIWDSLPHNAFGGYLCIKITSYITSYMDFCTDVQVLS